MNQFDRTLLDSNLVGAKNLEELHEKEKILLKVKEASLRKNPIIGGYDYIHLKRIHKYLFEDIYTWAGQDRYEMGNLKVFRKGNSEFTLSEKLPIVSEQLFNALKEEHFFKNQSRDEIIDSLSSFYNGLNILHPFREGNGRTTRIYLEQLAKLAGYQLDLSNVSKSMILNASIQGFNGHLSMYKTIIKLNIKPL